MGLARQVGLLLWKNWLLQKRKLCVSIFEVLMPVGFAALILMIRTLIETEEYPDPKLYNRNPVILDNHYFEDVTVLGYSPSNTETDKVMNYVEELFLNYTPPEPNSFLKNFSLKAFDNEEEMLDYFKYHSDTMRHVIVFTEVTSSSTSLPNNVKFAVRPFTGTDRWRTRQTFPFFQTNSPREGDEPPYLRRGVMYMQRLVGQALIKYWLEKEGDTRPVNIEVFDKRMAYPPYFDDPMIPVIQEQLPLFLVLSFILSVIVNTKSLVYEKERKLKESMKLMGLSASAHWISWFLTFTIYLVPALAIYAILFGVDISEKTGPVLANSAPTLFFVFLVCYGLALISFCFMVSTFVQKANVGAALGGILFFAFFFPNYFISPRYEDMDKGPKLAAGLLFNTAMGLGAKVIGIYEGTGEGALWSNFHKPATVDDNLSLLECMIILLVDTAIHLLITWYLDNVRPGEFGVPKPLFFCFTKSYWCGANKVSDSAYEIDTKDEKHFEREPSGLEAGIKICGLRKKFGNKLAVAGTSLNMYDGQISVLLGHNGAGKTTTMSMLTGFIPPSSGTALVNGCDIRSDISGVRKSLGLCPQHNILFGPMTVREHLTFFAKLKGSTGNIQSEVLAMAKEVGLEAKINDSAKNLSGGQKRKLSVGIALIGGSKIVILDEPTSGMDPAARRQTWNVLQRHRQDRTMVLSTHYMDEADLLGDRIAIMAEGVVKCCGSSMFLKKLYGAGYHLVVVKEPHCDVQLLTSHVLSHVASAEMESVINTEVSYLLPDNESSRFADLFRSMESMKEKLGVISFGTSATTMEEVFLKVGESAFDDETSSDNGACSSSHSKHSFTNPMFTSDKPDNNEKEALKDSGVIAPPIATNGNVDLTPEDGHTPIDIMNFNKGYTKHTGLKLNMSRMRGLFVKKAIHTWRNRSITLAQLLLPIIFTIIGLAIDESRPESSEEPAMNFDLSRFGRTYIPYAMGEVSTAAEMQFLNMYANQFGSKHTTEKFNVTSSFSYDDYVVNRAKDLGTSTYNKKMIVGVETIQGNGSLAPVSHFNGQPYHSQPIAMNFLMNSLLQYFTDGNYSLESSINPLPKDEEENNKFNSLLALSAGFSIGFFISFGMSFLTTMFIYFLIKEREVGSKHLQVVSGVGPITYWIPTLLWDFINYIVPSLLLIVVFLAYQKSAYTDDNRWALVILVLAVYGWAVLPFMYFLQFGFRSPPTGVVIVIMLNIITGLVTSTTVFVLKIPGLNLEDTAEQLNWIFMVLFPNYNMQQSFTNIYTNYMNIDSCEPIQPLCNSTRIQRGKECCKDYCKDLDFCVDFEENYLAWDLPGIGSFLLFMAIQGFFYMTTILLIEYHVFQRIWYLIRGVQTADNVESVAYMNEANMVSEDSDVAAERHRINSSPASVLSSTDSLLLVNLFKRYGSFTAVDQICVGVPEQECFGLLGQNGAGKTTTFKMLTGDVMVTGGNAYLKGFDVRSDIKSVQANMGYCPQFDALIDQMTGRETLIMYARLRGVPEPHIRAVVNTLLDVLMLREHADKLAGVYSGGNKRKLSTAISLVGDPPFIMLDEPSSGMDPKARRQLWNVLSQIRASGRTLVLTSHSMEECDALCTRIAIMVNGRFMCLGSPQHLKNKFGQGYTLIVQLGLLEDGRTAPNEPVVNFIQENFPGTKVFDDHQGYIHFQVPDSTVKLADVFSLMESTKVNLHVDDYSVHQTTLEQVFLTFTKGQVPQKEQKSYSVMTRLCCCCCMKCGCYK